MLAGFGLGSGWKALIRPGASPQLNIRSLNIRQLPSTYFKVVTVDMGVYENKGTPI